MYIRQIGLVLNIQKYNARYYISIENTENHLR